MTELAGAPEKLVIEQFADRSPARFDLGANLSKPESGAVQQFDSAIHKYTELERLNNNTFFYNMNRLNFAEINFSGIGNTLFGMVKRTRTMFDQKLEAMTAGPADGKQFTPEEMYQKQMSSYITNIEFDLISKSVSKSVENIYILLRQ